MEGRGRQGHKGRARAPPPPATPPPTPHRPNHPSLTSAHAPHAPTPESAASEQVLQAAAAAGAAVLKPAAASAAEGGRATAHAAHAPHAKKLAEDVLRLAGREVGPARAAAAHAAGHAAVEPGAGRGAAFEAFLAVDVIYLGWGSGGNGRAAERAWAAAHAAQGPTHPRAPPRSRSLRPLHPPRLALFGVGQHFVRLADLLKLVGGAGVVLIFVLKEQAWLAAGRGVGGVGGQSAASARAPALRRMLAVTSSPHFRSGEPTTAASATPGCSYSRSSTSRE